MKKIILLIMVFCMIPLASASWNENTYNHKFEDVEDLDLYNTTAYNDINASKVTRGEIYNFEDTADHGDAITSRWGTVSATNKYVKTFVNTRNASILIDSDTAGAFVNNIKDNYIGAPAQVTCSYWWRTNDQDTAVSGGISIAEDYATALFGIESGQSVNNWVYYNGAWQDTGIAITNNTFQVITCDGTNCIWFIDGVIAGTNSNTGGTMNDFRLFGGNNARYSKEYFDEIKCFQYSAGKNSSAVELRTNILNYSAGYTMANCDYDSLSTNVECWVSADNGTTFFNASKKDYNFGATNDHIVVRFNLTNDNEELYNFTLTLTGNPPTFSNNFTNSSAPRAGDYVRMNITIASATEVDGYIFSWDNGTGNFINDSFVDLGGLNFIENVSVVKEVTATAGSTVQWKVYANNTDGIYAESEVTTFLVAGTTPPVITLNPNNFFNVSNVSILAAGASSMVRLNFTLTDDISLFGFELNISYPNGSTLLYLTNTTATGTSWNYTTLIDVEGSKLQGNYTVNLTAWDSHTAQIIPDYEIRKGINYLLFDRSIRITAENAISSNTHKKEDKYDFEFNYIPILTPSKKTYYLESDGDLTYIQNSKYNGHFVDWKNKKWIDFEGIDGKIKITKIHNKKWKIEIDNKKDKVIFQSIGGLNSQTEIYKYYMVNPLVAWGSPTTAKNTFIGDEIAVTLNVTSDYKNRTEFRLYNSSFDLIDSDNLTLTGTGLTQYTNTFSNGLTDTTYYINATHYDQAGGIINSTTLSYFKTDLDNCSKYTTPAINYSFFDEESGDAITADVTGTYTFDIGGDTTDSFNLAMEEVSKFSICIFPSFESVTADYTLSHLNETYPLRRFSETDVTLDNITQTVSLYLLDADAGIYVRFKVVDSFQNPLSGVLGDMQLSIDGTLTTVEKESTDDSGLATFWVNPDNDYTFTFSLTGYQSYTATLRPTTSEIITITLQAEGEEEQESYSTGIAYDFYPKESPLQNKTDYNFRFNLSSSFWNITGCTLYLKNASTTLTQSSSSFNTTNCNIGIDFNTGNQSSIISEATLQINNTINQTFSKQYAVSYTYVGDFSLQNFIDDLKNFSGAGFNDFTRMIFAFIIIFTIVGISSFKHSIFREAEPLIILTIVLIFFFTYIGWLTLNFETIPEVRGMPTGWLKQYLIFVLSLLGGGAYILKNKY